MEDKVFNSEDIVVYKGIISKYAIIKDFVDLNDRDNKVRKADKEEIVRYENAQ